MDYDMDKRKYYTMDLYLSTYEYECMKILSMQKGMCISEIVEMCIADLTNSDASNEFEVTKIANKWIECATVFGGYGQNRLFRFLYYIDYPVEQFCRLYDNIATSSDEVEVEKLMIEYNDIINRYADTMSIYNFDEVDLPEEIEMCKKWLNDIQERKENQYGD